MSPAPKPVKADAVLPPQPGRLKIRYVNPHRLTPSPYNPRIATDAQRARLRASLETFAADIAGGLVEPLIHNTRTGWLVGGHLRRELAIETSPSTRHPSSASPTSPSSEPTTTTTGSPRGDAGSSGTSAPTPGSATSPSPTPNSSGTTSPANPSKWSTSTGTAPTGRARCASPSSTPLRSPSA